MRKTYFKFICLILISIYTFSSCSDKAPVVDNTPNILSIAACNHDSLSVDTLYYDLLGSEIKLPTVFTPNGDGIDDFFYPRFEEEGIVITQYSIYTPEEWSDARIMYSINQVVYDETEEQPDRAWDGMSKYTEPPYIADYEGPFRFRFFATKEINDTTGARITCRGWACVDKSN